MAFNEFQSIAHVLRKYPLKVRHENFLPEAEIELPDSLMENIEFSLEMKGVDENETYYAESFIFPFLQQAWKQHRRLKLWSHQTIAHDQELYGEPDYLIAAVVDEVTDRLIQKPLLAVTEAKKEDFTKGWGQSLAAMIACQKINGDESIVIYGTVSTGILWEFGKLAGNVFTKQTFSYSINEPKKILGLLDFIFAECEREAIGAQLKMAS